MHQLVAQNVVGLRQRPGEGQHDPALEDLGDTARGFAELVGDCVRLLELRVRRVENERLPPPELVIKEPGETRVPALHHAPRVLDRLGLARVVVDVEVLRLQNLKVEAGVPHLVAAEILGIAGISLEKAGNGIEAIDLVKEMDFDLVLMDIQMPEMDGVEATRIIRKMYDKDELPIIAMTANTMKGDKERYLASGMNDYVSKPIDAEELFSTLRRNISKISQRFAPEKQEPGVPAISLPDLPGLDIQAGLKRLANNRHLYLKILKEFKDKYQRAAEDIKGYLEEDDKELALRQSHTIKGLAGNCSAKDLQIAAQDLEQAIKEDQKHDYENLLNNFRSSLVQVLESISTLENSVEDLPARDDNVIPAQSADIDPVTGKMFQEMSEYLIKRKNAKAEACMISLKKKLSDTRFKEDAIQMELLMEKMDYKTAHACLKSIAENSGFSLA